MDTLNQQNAITAQINSAVNYSTAIRAYANNPAGTSSVKAMYAENDGHGYGVYAKSNLGIAVYGESSVVGPGSAALVGMTHAPSGSGILGVTADGGNGFYSNVAVQGSSGSGIGVAGQSATNNGVTGYSSSGNGVYASSVYGSAVTAEMSAAVRSSRSAG